MKMSKRAEKALRASIKHWKIDVLKNNIRPSYENCPLCQLYNNWDTNPYKICKPCPIYKKTKSTCCDNTVYPNYMDAYKNHEYAAMKKHARAMIKFMTNLLPKAGEK